MSRLADTHLLTPTYTSGEPDQESHTGSFSIEDNVESILLSIKMTLTTTTGDPGYGVGNTADYDTLLDMLVCINRMKLGYTSDKPRWDIRSDTIAFLDAIFYPEPWHMDTLPTTAVASTAYYAQFRIPFRARKDVGKIAYVVTLNSEANMYTTVANGEITALEIGFTPVYENWAYSLDIEDVVTDSINNSAGKDIPDTLSIGRLLAGFIVAGEQEGTQDLSKIILKHEGKYIINQEYYKYLHMQTHVSHNKVTHTNFNNTMFIVLDRAVEINNTTNLKIATSAAQDFLLTKIYIDEVADGVQISGELITGAFSQPTRDVSGRMTAQPASQVLTREKGVSGSVGTKTRKEITQY